MQESDSFLDSPKFLINDLKKCHKRDDINWEFNISAKYSTKTLNKSITFSSVYLQGFIDQKPCDDVIILRDCTGRLKLTNCIAGIDKNLEMTRGSYCSVIGIFMRETGLPEVYAQKIVKLEHTEMDKNLYLKYWPFEVRDYQLFLLGVVKPSLGLS